MTSSTPVANFERKYVIHSNGQIWNLEKHDWQTTSMNPNGYFKVVLCLNGKHQFLVHQLVALHFLPNPYGYKQVNHKDGNKANNAVSNLEWVSASGNIQHSLKLGLRSGFMASSEKHDLLLRVLAGELIRDIAKEIGRREESLSGMLRRYAHENGLGENWSAEMPQRRKDVAVRNLASINA